MKKIKLFLITLLCMVGVMHVCAQTDFVTATPATQQVKESLGNHSTSGLGSTWSSNASYSEEGNRVTVHYNLTDDNTAFTYRDDNPRFATSILRGGTVTVTAPQYWVITGFKFTPSEDGAYVMYENSRCANNEEKKVTGLEVGSFTLQTIHNRIRNGYVTLGDFEVFLEKRLPSINDNLANTVNGHWTWNQETPQNGHLYKIINATSDAKNIRAVSPKNNNTVSGNNANEGSTSSIVVNDIMKAGEWLFVGDDNTKEYTITGVDEETVLGVYQSHVAGTGATKDSHWMLENNTIYEVPGYHIYTYYQDGSCFLKLSSIFETVDEVFSWEIGDMGWSGQGLTGLLLLFNGSHHSLIHLWNFYSIEQYDCYVDFMTAYNAFDELYAEYYNNTDYPEYKEVYDIVNEAGKRWQGETDETREETYDIIDRMLDVIATIKGGGEHIDPTPADGHEWPIDNPDAEHNASFDAWRTRRIPTTETSKAVTVKNSDAAYGGSGNMFELKNSTMSQMVTNLNSGVYELSVYWKTDNNPNAEITLNAKSSAEEKYVTVKGSEASSKDEDNGFTKAVVEVVVVDGRLTVSASADTKSNGSVYLDKFELKYICKNYWYEEEQTRVYRGVFLNTESSGANVDNTPDGKERKDPDGKASAVVDDKIPFADITQAYFVSFDFVNTANPNGLCYTKAETTKKITTTGKDDEVNVIRCHVDKDGNIVDGECKSLMLEDGHPYSAKANFNAKMAHYKMTSVATDAASGNTFGSLMLPYAVSAPDGVTAWKLTAASDGKTLYVETIDGEIPANSPVLVSGGGDFDKAVAANAQGFDVFTGVGTQNKFGDLQGIYNLVPDDNGNLVPFKAPVGSYVLQKQGNRVAYFLVKGGDNSSPAVKPFRSYLEVPGGSSANSLAFEFIDEETNGISDVEFECENGAIYDLSGRRVQQLVRGGIYIVNGKKFMVK